VTWVFRDNRYIATGGQDKKIIIWRIGSKKIHRLIEIDGHNNAVTSLVFDKTTNNLYSASRDRKIKYWKLDRLLLSHHK